MATVFGVDSLVSLIQLLFLTTHLTTDFDAEVEGNFLIIIFSSVLNQDTASISPSILIEGLDQLCFSMCFLNFEASLENIQTKFY